MQRTCRFEIIIILMTSYRDVIVESLQHVSPHEIVCSFKMFGYLCENIRKLKIRPAFYRLGHKHIMSYEQQPTT